MYDGWQPCMKSYASDILLLADYLLADSVVDMAVVSLKECVQSNNQLFNLQ